MQSAGVPLRYLGARLDDFSPGLRPCLNDAGLLLHGPTGGGKTHLACALLADALPALAYYTEHRGYVRFDAVWTTVPNVLASLRQSYSDSAIQSEHEIIRDLIRPPLLVLDDLGAEKTTDWSLGTLYQIISTRINNMALTIVTTNLTLPELNTFDARLASRLAGMTVMEITGPDRRLRRCLRERGE